MLHDPRSRRRCSSADVDDDDVDEGATHIVTWRARSSSTLWRFAFRSGMIVVNRPDAEALKKMTIVGARVIDGRRRERGSA
jgi:hypothetical protein